MSHGAPMDAMRHEGDMGNIEADEAGNAHLEYVDKTMSFDGDASIIGRSIIVHQNEDDMKTQPTGNAGRTNSLRCYWYCQIAEFK